MKILLAQALFAPLRQNCEPNQTGSDHVHYCKLLVGLLQIGSVDTATWTGLKRIFTWYRASRGISATGGFFKKKRAHVSSNDAN